MIMMAIAMTMEMITKTTVIIITLIISLIKRRKGKMRIILTRRKR